MSSNISLFLLDSNFRTECNIFRNSKIERREPSMSMKVIAYDVGTTGLKACLFSVSRDEGIAYITSTVEDYNND